jgi:hypothetical protein
VARTPNSLVAKENPRTLKTNPENKIRGGRFGTECRMKELAKRLETPDTENQKRRST